MEPYGHELAQEPAFARAAFVDETRDHQMKALGSALMTLGALIGVAVGVAMLAHAGIAAPWLVNVALGKLGLVASGALMAGGALGVKLGKRQEQAKLRSGEPKER